MLSSLAGLRDLNTLTLKVRLEKGSFQFLREDSQALGRSRINEEEAKKTAAGLFEGIRAQQQPSAIEVVTLVFHAAEPSQKIWTFEVQRKWTTKTPKYDDLMSFPSAKAKYETVVSMKVEGLDWEDPGPWDHIPR